MRVLRWIVIAGLTVLAIVVTGVALVIHGHATGWIVAKRSVETWVEALEPHIAITRPDGEGPYPVVAIFHGCGGVRPHHDTWADVAADEGYLALVVDGFAAREISRSRALREICSGSRLWGRERAGDVVATLELIERLPDADPSRIVLFGQSHGAWAIMDLLAMDLERKGPTGLRPPPDPDVRDGVIASILFYPYCGTFSLTGTEGWRQVPSSSLMIVPTEDQIVSSLACRETADRLLAADVPLDLELFEGIDHAFDQVEHPKGSPLVYDADATRTATDLVRRFLRDVKT